MGELLFYAPIISVFLIVGMRYLEMGKNRHTIRGEVHEFLTFRFLLIVGTSIAISSILEYFYVRGSLTWGSFFLGWFFGISAFAIRRRAIAALGKFWSLHVEIRAEHVFVRHGPFRFVRHPAYLSMILELMALTTICRAWYTMLAIPLFYGPVLFRRIRLEERALIAKFGVLYEEYRHTTPALLPRPW